VAGSVTLLTLLAKLGLDASDFNTGLDEAVKKSSTGSSGIVKNLSTAGAIGVTALGAGTGAALGLGAAITKASMDAAPLQGIQAAYEGITGGGEEMLAMLRQQSAGMITDRALMTSYNLAAQLVGKTFADQLPDAIGYLTKVAAATGQDMDYMMDSLVRGVGRLSPMILDNLGIQVDLEEAYQVYAASIGKVAGELTKEEQQVAVMNQVMKKLAANTASMPDVAGTASAGMASLGVQIQNLRDRIGVAFLPVLQTLLTALGDLASEYGPRLAETFERLLPHVLSFVETVVANIPQAIETFENIVSWLQEHEGIVIGVLVALGVAISAWVYTTVIPAAAAAIAAIAPIAAPILAIAAVVALLYEAWTNDWGGIQTFLTNVWENYLQPVFQAIAGWLGENIPKAIEVVRGFWLDKLQPALQAVWAFIDDKVLPLFRAVGEVLSAVVGKAAEATAGLWQNVLAPAIEWVHDKLKQVWEYIDQNILPIYRTMWELIEGPLGVAFQWFSDHVLAGWKLAFEGIGAAISKVTGWLEGLAGKIGALKLPDWLTPGSPTPFELGLRGIADAMADLTKIELPQLETGLGSAGSSARQVATPGGSTTINIMVDLRGGNGETRHEASIGVLEALRAAGVA